MKNILPIIITLAIIFGTLWLIFGYKAPVAREQEAILNQEEIKTKTPLTIFCEKNPGQCKG